MQETASKDRHHVVIIGGGFGGLYAAQELRGAPVRITLVDKRNFHLFQPLLYQVATGGISPGDIASPLRAILQKQTNVTVLHAEVVDIDPQGRTVRFRDGELQYDSLIVAAGAEKEYFGNQAWEPRAPSLKTVEDALEIRRRVFLAFEAAERETDPEKRAAWMNFVVIGGGPTGVELAGALAELAHGTLKKDFRSIDPRRAQVIVLEGLDELLPAYPDRSSEAARQALERLGVMVSTGRFVKEIQGERVIYQTNGQDTASIETRTVVWAAGMRASSLSDVLEQRAGARLDRGGRVMVGSDLSLAEFPEVLVIGDMAHFAGEDGQPLPGIAPVAMQQGRYVARLLQARLKGRQPTGFAYRDKGMLAVIGRNAAVAVFGRLQFSGFLAWLIWIFVHLWYLIEFDNKLLVLIQWAWNYFTRKRGARLITGEDPLPRQ